MFTQLRLRAVRSSAAFTLVLLLVTACGAEDGGGNGPGDGPLDLTGAWLDDYGAAYEIAEDLWRDDYSSYQPLDWSNAERWVVARNDDDNAFNPGAFSRFDWAEQAGDTWLCQTVFDAASEDAAREAAPADPADPATAGCGTFPWTRLFPASGPELTGGWADSFGGSWDLGATTWTFQMDASVATYLIETFSNVDNRVVAANDSTNAYDPGKWSAFDWTVDGTGRTWLCQTAFAADDAMAAAETPFADATDPATAGCGGFPWTELLEP
jgi:hypothetical protein